MSQAAPDPVAFRAFEEAGWQTAAGAYHRFFGPISAHAITPLLDAAGVGRGTRLLDVATGPGYVAAQADARGAAVVGIDLAMSMVKLARTRHPAVAFHQADAEDLPFPPRTFDAVVGNLALQHLPRPERAVGEFARVLAPGGVVALTAWDVPAESRLMGIVVDAVGAAGAAAPPDLPPGPPVFRYSTDGAFGGLLSTAGFTKVLVRTIRFTHRLPDTATYWEGMMRATVRTAALVVRQPPEIQQRIRDEFDRLSAVYQTGDGLLLPIAIKLAVGRRAMEG